MEEDVPSPLVLDGTVCDINLSLATTKEICTSCANDVSITHPSQLTNPFLGLPLESGKCEACGTAEHGQCEGHFGYIQLPIPIYHPSHVIELKHILNLVCLKCLRMKKEKDKRRIQGKTSSSSSCMYCKVISCVFVLLA
uniref:DNA-directed RNA polymerase n=1 Tax=Anthurium amnicola TaxID=1678845 RepID=A0A1D1YKW3_9ARAE